MKQFKLIEYKPDDTEPVHGYRNEYRKDAPLSRALVLENYGESVVLHFIGADLEWEMEQVGELQIGGDDWGYSGHDVDGLWIWEGRMVTHKNWTSCGYEYDTEPEGDYRRLTQDEWNMFKEDPDIPPWDCREWFANNPTDKEWMESVHGV